MASNEEALAATALALGEDHKAKKPRGKGKASAVFQEKKFILEGEDADELRDILKESQDDDTTYAKGESPLEMFWAKTGRLMEFDSKTVALKALPDEGNIEFSAITTKLSDLAAAMADDAPKADAPFGTGAHKGDAPAAKPVTDKPNPFDSQPDAEEMLSAGLEQMESAALDLDAAAGTLVGDLTNGLLEIIKRQQKPWDAHSQHEKRDLVASIEHIAQIVTRKAVDAIASNGQESIKAILEKIAIGDKTMITLKLGSMSPEEQEKAITALFHAQKKSVLIVTADSDRFMGKRRELVEADEEELPFDAGADEEDGEVPY